jgi:hypothetical protein
MADAVAAPAAPAAAPSTSAAPAAAPAATKTSGDATNPVGGAPEITASDAAKALAKHRMTLKLKGQSVDREFSNEELQLHVQKSLGGELAFEDAAKERKRIETFLAKGKEDPFTVAKELWGIDLMERAQAQLGEKFQKELAMAKMSPEERLKQDYESRLAEAQAVADKYKADHEARETKELEERVFAETEMEFGQALQYAGIEKSHEALAEMAHVKRLALQHDYDLTPEQLATEVRNRIESRRDKLHSSVMGGLKGSALLQHLGPDVVKEVIRARLAEGAPQAPAPAAVVKRDTPKQLAKETITRSEFWKRAMLGK